MVEGSTTWIKRYRLRPGARLRLFCFPHAGGGAAAFLRWSQRLPEDIEVCAVELPGRLTRYREEPFTRMAPLVDAVVSELEPFLDKPFAMFGNSMGSLVAFETARLLRRRHLGGPTSLFLCGRNSPDVPPVHEPFFQLPDRELIESLRFYYGGIPSVILDEPEILSMALRTLRADLELVETYNCQPEAPLDCDISLFAGSEDPSVDEASLARWEAQTRGECEMTFLPGDHTFVETQAEGLQRRVVASLLRP